MKVLFVHNNFPAQFGPVARALATAVVDSGTHAVLAPAQEHPLNFVLEHAMLKALARRGVDVTVRRSPIPDDSLKILFGRPGDPVVEYTLGSAKVTYLRYVGMLPDALEFILDQGVVGDEGTHPTAMPAWRLMLSEQEKWEVVYYARQLAGAEKAGAK